MISRGNSAKKSGGTSVSVDVDCLSGPVFGDAVVATAILDRLLHHSQVITIRGDSHRLRETRRADLHKATTLRPARVA